jgi:hypothetical protein
MLYMTTYTLVYSIFHIDSNKTIVEMHYDINNNVLKSELTINSIYIHNLISIYVSI